MIPLRGEGDSEEPKAGIQPTWATTAWLIVKCLCSLTLTGVLAYRLANAHVHFEDFNFSQLLELVLALFSIGLSATFYFKATETSNRFYDRTYRMTKDLFEILGRMDERFGERLQGIRDDTSEMRREFTQSSGERRKPVVEESVTTAQGPATVRHTEERH